MDFDYKTADITRRDDPQTAVPTWYLANRQGMRVEVLGLGGIVSRVVVIGGDLKKHNVVLGTNDISSYAGGAFASAALHTPTPGVPSPANAWQEERHLVMESTLGTGCTLTTRFALTEGNELVVGRTIALAPNAASALVWPDIWMPIYLNLAGQEPGNVLDHAIAIDATRCWDTAASSQTPEDDACADFRTGKTLASDILLSECLGGEAAPYDRCFLLEKPSLVDPVATVYCSRSRIYLDVCTTAPALRLSTFRPLGGIPVPGRSASPYGNHSGLALEPAPLFRSALQPGESWENVTVYRFTTDYPEGYYTDNGCVDRIL